MKVEKLISKLSKLPPGTEIAFVCEDERVFISKDLELSTEIDSDYSSQLVVLEGGDPIVYSEKAYREYKKRLREERKNANK